MLLRRLNPYCTQTLEVAASLRRTRTHAEIIPGHWLLRLLEQGEGDIIVIARRYEWDIDNLRRSLLKRLDVQPCSVGSHPQLSDAFLSLMQQAWLCAATDKNSQIRGVHLLMALVGKPSLLKCDGLWPLLSTRHTQLEHFLPLLNSQSDEHPGMQQETSLVRVSPDDKPRPAESTLSLALQGVLDKFALDMTAEACAGDIDPVFGHDNEIRQMVDVLSHRRKNNPILVGEPGVGKTTLVESLALHIAEDNVPDSLKSVTLYTLDLRLLQAGAGVKDKFGQRLKNIVNTVQQSPTPILFFIDGAHTIIGAGNRTRGADAASLLKPALTRGELRAIAATTWSEYKQYFERDAVLGRCFQMVKVDKSGDDTACLMLRDLKSRYAERHDVHVTGEAVKTAVTLSRRYLTGRQLPDKAIDPLDTAGVRMQMSLDTVPEPLTRLKSGIIALEMEKQVLLADLTVENGWHGERLATTEQRENLLFAELGERETQYGQELTLIE